MTVYALKHPDGRWLYHLPKPDHSIFGRWATVTGTFADGRPMEHLHGDWWATDSEASRLTMTAQPYAKTVGYRLVDPAAESVRYPATLSLQKWEEREDREGDALRELYTSMQEQQPALEHVYDGPVMVLEGREPPSPDEPQWIAELPRVLAERPEYLHLFPGRIPGLRKHLHDVIEKMPRVRHCFDNFQGYTGLHVMVAVPYDQPQTRWQADLSRRTGKPLKTGRTVPVTVERRLRLPVPADVTADSYAQALTAWDEQVTFWTGLVESATVAACSACQGTGHVPHGAETYTTR